MIRWLRCTAAVVGVISLNLARVWPLASIPLVGHPVVDETPWGTWHRLWIAMGLLAVAELLAVFRKAQPWAILASGCALGFILDLSVSASAWYVENLALLKEMGSKRVAEGIQIGAGTWVLATATLCIAIHAILAAAGADSPASRPSSRSAPV